jgi:gliding motility-associated-like protein
MKREILTIILSLAGIIGYGQNMVPNGGFEEYNSCPTNWAQIDYSPAYISFPTVKDWVSPLQQTTPDYFNSCAAAGSKVNIPATFLGTQDAYNGNGCAGFISYYYSNAGGEYREYIQAKLKAPMIAGHKHRVVLYVSSNYNPSITAYNYIGVDRVGVAFTNNAINHPTDRTLMLDYAVVNDSGAHLTIPNNWIKVEGTYIAQGGEQWIQIGTFKTSATPHSFVQVYPTVPNSGTEDYCYMFVDDVTVTDLDKVNTFTSAHDTAVCDAAGMVLISPVATNNYLWNTGATTPSITLTDSGTYWCRAKINNNEYIDTFHVGRKYFYPSLSLGNDTLICRDDNYTLGRDLALANYYSWSTGATGCCIIPKESGQYFLTTSNGCDLLSDTINITTVACDDCFWAPNAFTPNADSKNDRFGVVPNCLMNKANFRIFDRWGNEMFSTSDLSQKWDGSFNGEPMPLGTYYFMVEYWLLANKPKQMFEGSIILLR